MSSSVYVIMVHVYRYIIARPELHSIMLHRHRARCDEYMYVLTWLSTCDRLGYTPTIMAKHATGIRAIRRERVKERKRREEIVEVEMETTSNERP